MIDIFFLNNMKIHAFMEAILSIFITPKKEKETVLTRSVIDRPVIVLVPTYAIRIFSYFLIKYVFHIRT